MPGEPAWRKGLHETALRMVMKSRVVENESAPSRKIVDADDHLRIRSLPALTASEFADSVAA